MKFKKRLGIPTERNGDGMENEAQGAGVERVRLFHLIAQRGAIRVGEGSACSFNPAVHRRLPGG